MKSVLLAAALVAAAPVLAIEQYPTQQTFNSVAQRPRIIEDNIVPLINNDRGSAVGLPLPAAVTPAPETGEWAMILAGLAVVGYVARRRKAALARA